MQTAVGVRGPVYHELAVYYQQSTACVYTVITNGNDYVYLITRFKYDIIYECTCLWPSNVCLSL